MGRLANGITAGAALIGAAAGARPADHRSPQAAVDAAYAVISGPRGAIDGARFDDLFTPGARFVMVSQGPGGRVAVRRYDRASFKPGFTAAAAGKPFYEQGRTIHADVGAAVATVLSDYRSTRTPGGRPFETGRNTFELIRLADGWHVDSVFWEARGR